MTRRGAMSYRRPSRFLISKLIIQSALVVACLNLAASHQGPRRTTRDTQSRPSWTLDEDGWTQWWSYSGVSGPAYWGLLNLDWFMCDRGRRQSPIDLNTRALVYDPHLAPMRVDNNLITGVLYNDGHSIVFNNSRAALSRFVALERQRAEQHQQRASTKSEPARHEVKPTGTNSTSHPISRRAFERAASSEIFTALNQQAAIAELIDTNASFVIEAAGSGLGDNLNKGPQLISEPGDNIELGIGETGTFALSGDRLQQDRRRKVGPPEADNPDELDQGLTDGNLAASHVHFSGAGSAYSYRFEAMQLKFGAGPVQSSGQSEAGSEHQIDGRSFAAELQLFAFNWQLYRSYAEAQARPYGLLGVSVLVDLLPAGPSGNEPPETGNRTNTPMRGNEQLDRLLVSATSSLGHRGAFALARDLNLSALLPETEQFVTYDGSLTQPGCQESVTWLVLNRPLYISKRSLDKLRSLSADELSATSPTGTLVAGNTRPAQPTNNRPLRTNIRPPTKTATNKPPQEVCPRLWTRYEYARQAPSPA